MRSLAAMSRVMSLEWLVLVKILPPRYCQCGTFKVTRVQILCNKDSFILWREQLYKFGASCLERNAASSLFSLSLIVTIAGFRVSIQSPDVGFLPEGFYSVDLLVVPMW
jgi:hypothetical protein